MICDIIDCGFMGDHEHTKCGECLLPIVVPHMDPDAEKRDEYWCGQKECVQAVCKRLGLNWRMYYISHQDKEIDMEQYR